MYHFLRNGLKNFAILFSFLANLILVTFVLILSIYLFTLTNRVVEPLIYGLHGNFVGLDDTNIIQKLKGTPIPAESLLPVGRPFSITLVEDVRLNQPAIFNLPYGDGTISGTVALMLPQGLELPIALGATAKNEIVSVNLLMDTATPVPTKPSPTETRTHTVSPTETPTPDLCCQTVLEGDTMIGVIGRCGHREWKAPAATAVAINDNVASADILPAAGARVCVPQPTADVPIPPPDEIDGEERPASSEVDGKVTP